MVLRGAAIYEYIIEEDNDEVSEVRPKDHIHRGLKGGRHVAETKWNYFEFVMAMVCAKSYFRCVCLVHSNLMVSL